MSNIVFDCISSVPLCKSHLETGKELKTMLLFEFLSIMSIEQALKDHEKDYFYNFASLLQYLSMVKLR